MSRNSFTCPHCKSGLGTISMPAAIWRPGTDAEIVFIDRDQDTVKARCVTCGEETHVRVRRIDLRNRNP